jgi:CDP-L-myo-inositol myo-inositolphosphotransferase
MESPQIPARDAAQPVLVSFPPGLADRRIAGVAAAARILRSLAGAGVREVWVDPVPAPATCADISRIAGEIRVRPTGEGGTPPGAIRLRGDRLVSPDQLRRVLAGSSAESCEGIALDAPDAARQILRLTGKASDGLVSRWINRPVSRRVSALLLQLPWIRPGHATALNALAATAMLACLLLGGEAGAVWGAILFQAASIVDGVDGEIARATFRTSARGAALDTAVDVATNLMFVLGLTVNLAARLGQEIALVGAGGVLLFAAGLALVAAKARRNGEPGDFDVLKRFYRDRAADRSRLVGFVTTVTSRDFFAFLFMALALAGLAPAILFIFAGAAIVWFLLVAAALAIGTGDQTGGAAGARSPAP